MCIRDRHHLTCKCRVTWRPPRAPRGSCRVKALSLIHISEPTRQAEISYAVFCLKKKRRPRRSTPLYSSAASDVYKRQTSSYLQVSSDLATSEGAARILSS